MTITCRYKWRGSREKVLIKNLKPMKPSEAENSKSQKYTITSKRERNFI